MCDRLYKSINTDTIPDNPYILLTPGPLSTTKAVRGAMLRDWCTWDRDYNDIVQAIRKELVNLGSKSDDYTAVLMQGSGTFSVESAIGTIMPRSNATTLLVLANGAYGERIATIAHYLNIPTRKQTSSEISTFDLEELENTLKNDLSIHAVAVVHCETTTGILNPIEAISTIVKRYNKLFIVDAMSSF